MFWRSAAAEEEVVEVVEVEDEAWVPRAHHR
jgi:hypothetical protein